MSVHAGPGPLSLAGRVARFACRLGLGAVVALVVLLLAVLPLIGIPDGSNSDGNSTFLSVVVAWAAVILAGLALGAGIVLRKVGWVGRAWPVCASCLLGLAFPALLVMIKFSSDYCEGYPHMC